MADYLYAAQIAQQGLRDLGKGMESMGQKNALRRLGTEYSANNPDKTGQFIGKSIEEGQMTPGQGVQLQIQDEQYGVDRVYGLMKKAAEGDKNAMAVVPILINAMTAFAKTKKGSGDGTGSSKEIEDLYNEFGYKGHKVNDGLTTTLHLAKINGLKGKAAYEFIAKTLPLVKSSAGSGEAPWRETKITNVLEDVSKQGNESDGGFTGDDITGQ